MYWIRFALLVLGMMVLQVSFGDVVAITSRDVRPNLLLVLMVYFALHGLPSDAVITSFAIGLAADLIGQTIGPNTLSFGICGTAMSSLRRYISIRKVPYQAVVILAMGALSAGLGRLLLLAKGSPVPQDLLTPVLLGPAYSAVVGPLLFVPLEWLMRLQDKHYRLGLR